MNKNTILDYRFLSCAVAARYLKITTQAVCLAVKNGRLKCKKHDRRLYFLIEDLKTYEKSKFKRPKPRCFTDSEKRSYKTVKEVSEKTGLHKGKLYYLIRKGMLKSKKVGNSFFIETTTIKLLEDLIKNIKNIKQCEK